MARCCLLLVALFLCAAVPTRAAEGPVGNWRVTVPVQTQRGPVTLIMLMMFSEEKDKWIGDFIDSSLPFGKEDPVMDLTVKEDVVKYSLKFGPNFWTFDGKIAPGGKRIKGSLDLGGDIVLVEMVSTTLKSLNKDPFAVQKEALDAAEAPQEFFTLLFPLVAQAAAKKMKVEDLRAYAEKATKLAEGYGTRWQRTLAFRMADALCEHEAYVGIAIDQARLGERLIGRNDDIPTQIATLEILARIFKKAKKETEAKEVEGKIAKLEPRDYAEYLKTNPPFKAEEFKGRKAKSDRVVVVEVFAGAERPASIAPVLAFDGLLGSYKPTEVIFLQYHNHLSGPDPLTFPDCDTRMEAYAKKGLERDGSFLFINGKPDDTSGSPSPKLAKVKYLAYKSVIEEMLEKPATAKLALTATLKADELSLKATVSDLEKPGEKVALRFAVVEDRIRYAGGNTLRYHHAVVRAMPGGAKGYPMAKKSAEQTATIKIADIRTALVKGLDEVQTKIREDNPEFSFPARPLALKNLRVVAFLQNDETGEILQAVQVELEAGKE